jgi:hypothetical protein
MAASIGAYFMAVVLLAFISIFWVGVIKSGNPALLVIPAVPTLGVIAALIWYVAVTPSRIDIREDGTVIFHSRLRPIETTASQVSMIRMSLLNFRTRTRFSLVSGRVLWVLNADFPDFDIFIFILLSMNPTIVPVGVPPVYPPQHPWS